MIITIDSDTICDGPDRSVNKNTGPENLQISAQTTAQVRRFLRVQNAKVSDRLGMVSQIAFGVTRLCADVAAAEAYSAVHPATVARSGTLTLGSVEVSDCVIDEVACRQMGVTVKIEYRITGGAMAIPSP